MRVIGGKAKGRVLFSPSGKEVRPTPDRVREAIFSSIQKYVPDALVLDLYAGAGTLGIEALSRYARKAIFVDQSPEHVQLIRENLGKTNLLQNAVLMCCDARAAIEELAGLGYTADIIFMDPPYDRGLVLETLQIIERTQVLSDKGIVVVECSLSESLPEGLKNLQLMRSKRYGITVVAYYCTREDLK